MVIHTMQVSFESQKSTYRWDKINPHGSWWYIQVLWSEMTGLCKKLNIISNTIICNPEPQANSPEWCPDHERIILWTDSFSKPVRQIGLNQSVTRAALYKLLNQNSLSDFQKKKVLSTFDFLQCRLEMRNWGNSSDPWIKGRN